MKNKILIRILAVMILWDFSLHLQELLGLPFYLNFDTRLVYTIFWTAYWFVGFVIATMIAWRLRHER